MISSEDIEAWREDEKKTEHSRRNADNHAGWEVQIFSYPPAGWVAIGPSFTSKDAAILALISWRKFWPAYEFRVYERVSPRGVK